MKQNPLDIVLNYVEAFEDPARLADCQALLHSSFRCYTGGTHRFSGLWTGRDTWLSLVASDVGLWPTNARLEVVNGWPVAEDLVVLHCRRSATVDGDHMEGGDYVAVFRVADGVIDEYVDLPGGRNNAFWIKHRS